MKRAAVALAVAAVLLAAGCAGPGASARDELPTDLAVAAVTSGATATPAEVEAGQLRAAGRYAEAEVRYLELARFEADPERRAELFFLAAECALGAGEHEDAHELYALVLHLYPGSPRVPTAVERVFLIGKLFCEGRAVRPSWLLGIRMTDRAFGIAILEATFQAGTRARHPLADDALHYRALAHHAQAELEQAVERWQTLAQEFPQSEWADTAEYRMARTFVELSGGAEYDKRPLYTGLLRLRRYLEEHPTGDHVTEATADIRAVEETLGEHYLEVARYYLRRDRGYSAQLYLAAVQRDFPSTDAARAAADLSRTIPASAPPPAPDPDDETRLPHGLPLDALVPTQPGAGNIITTPYD